MLVLTNLYLYTTAIYNDTTYMNITTNNSSSSSVKNIVTSHNKEILNGDNYKTHLTNNSTKEIESEILLTHSSTTDEIKRDAQEELEEKRDGNKGRKLGDLDFFNNNEEQGERVEQREIDDAVDLGMRELRELVDVKEPLWYQLGLVLGENDPASKVANFGKPNRHALRLSQFGYAALEASRKLSKSFPENVKDASFRRVLKSRIQQGDCPLKGRPHCPPEFKFFRTPDGTCNNLAHPWWGASLLPMERFLVPQYEDDIQEIRRSKSGRDLPSARDVSVRVHRDISRELPTVTLMFMQWGQFVDHDIISMVKPRSFNGSIPRCCGRDGPLPPDLTHPSCLPIKVSEDDWFLARFGVRCLEFLRNAPATRLNCDLGWREQMNQMTSYIDGSTIYGSNLETSDAVRTFRNGKLQYGRPLGNGPLDPPDPPGGELCRSGALSTECFVGADGRFGEQPALTAMHTVWVRFHNRLATTLGKLNKHWNDERIFQETRKIIGALIQHITYREFLPIVVGPEVMELFELSLNRKGFFNGYDERVNPAIANSFGTAAFRFGHSLVQNSFMRFDGHHRPLFNNVSLHMDEENLENIWSFGSVDRILLGLANQPSQRRDEFICEELTNNLFRGPNSPFGLDLAAINVQRGRDHGLPPYTAWRKPCGLSEIKDWKDLQNILNVDTTRRLRLLYEDVDDIDLFTAGLAEKPVRGGIVGPTFACIIAQQFSNLRKGDRFWYENPGFPSSFTQAQLSQIKRITFSEILCQTMREFQTIQPFVFLSADNMRNERISCENPLVNRFDLAPWTEDIEPLNDNTDDDVQNRDIKDLFDFEDHFREERDTWEARKRKRTQTTRKPNRHTKTTTSAPDLKIPVSNVSVYTIPIEKNYYNNDHEIQNFPYYQPIRYTTKKYYSIRDKNDYTYLFGRVSSTTPVPRTSSPKKSQTPLEVNIKIQYFPPTPQPPKRTVYGRPQNSNGYGTGYSNRPQKRPTQVIFRPNSQSYNDEVVAHKRPSSNLGYSFGGQTYVLQPSQKPQYDLNQNTNDDYYEQEPSVHYYHQQLPDDSSNKPDIYDQIENVQYDETDEQSQHYSETDINDKEEVDRVDQYDKRKFTNDEKTQGNRYSIAYIEKLSSHNKNDKLDFRTRLVYKRKFQKPSREDDEDDGYVSSEEYADEQFDPDSEERQEKASYREGGTLLNKNGFDKAEYEKIKLVDIKVIKKKTGRVRWKPFDDIEIDNSFDWTLPNMTQDIHYSEEIPTKINNKNSINL